MGCVPTAKQRMRLQELSLRLFGTSSKWQKIMRDTRIPHAELDREATTDPNDPKFKIGYRQPSIDETLMALEDNLVASDLSKLPQDVLITTLAKQFMDSELRVRLAIQIPAKELAESEDLFALLDAPVAERVKGLVIDDKTHPQGAFVVRGIDFLTELAYLKDPTLREAAPMGVLPRQEPTTEGAST